jgi:hypothetical protein
VSRRAILFLFLVTGCAGLGTGDALDPLPTPGDAGAGGAGMLHVEIGTGVELYEPLSDGAPVDVVLGPQGGFHIWTSVRVDDPSVELARIDLNARFADDGRPAGNPSSITVSFAAVGTAREHAGMTCFVVSPEAVHARSVVLHADLFVKDGRHGSAERLVIPR